MDILLAQRRSILRYPTLINTNCMVRERCNCFSRTNTKHRSIPAIHHEEQDTECESWRRLLDLVESAAESGAAEFAPFREFTREQRVEIVTLPRTIAKLKSVLHLNIYGSSLVRIPPEIGQMELLETFSPYTSYFLHWFPYEITRCKNLRESTVSTRAIYGNHKYRPPFPHLPLRDSEKNGVYSLVTPKKCSVCNEELDQSNVWRRWISLAVATDVLPLLVNACSRSCLDLLPATPENYVSGPHTGGQHIQQPPPHKRRITM